MTMKLSNIKLEHYYNSQSLDYYILYYLDTKLGVFTLAKDPDVDKFVFNPVSDYYTLDESEAILWATHKLKDDKIMRSDK